MQILIPSSCDHDKLAGRVWHFGFETSRFRNFSIFFYGIGIGFGNFWYRKKYWYRFRNFLVSKKVLVSVLKKKLVLKNMKFKKMFFDGIGFENFCIEKRTQIFMIFSITLNLQQYEQGKVFLIKLSIFIVGRTEVAKEDASKWRKWWILIMAKITLILTNATSVNRLPFGGAVWGDI